MSDRIQLREICHARAGDKGDTANVGLIAYAPQHYDWIAQHVTADTVRRYLGEAIGGEVERYALPKIGAFNFVLHNALGGGVTRALKVDGHGKGLSAVVAEPRRTIWTYDGIGSAHVQIYMRVVVGRRYTRAIELLHAD